MMDKTPRNSEGARDSDVSGQAHSVPEFTPSTEPCDAPPRYVAHVFNEEVLVIPVSHSRADELARWAKSLESPITWEPRLCVDTSSAAARDDRAWFESHPRREYRVRRPLEGDNRFDSSDAVLVRKDGSGFRRIAVCGSQGVIKDSELLVSFLFFVARAIIAARRADGHGEDSVIQFSDVVELTADPIELDSQK